MSSFDTHSILAYSTIASVTSQSGSTLIIVVQTGDGAKFAINQQVIIWVQGAQPNSINAMVCRITAISGDTITLDYSTGNKEGTSTRTVLATDQISNTVTPKVLTDIESITLTGWTPAGDTFTYASANSFTIAGVDRTTTYTKGTRIKFTNNSITFYGVVISSSFSTDTTVNLAPNADYAIANSAITAPLYSYQASPQGYPTIFNYTTTWGGFSSNPTQQMKFSIIGKICTVHMGAGSVGVSNATTVNFTLPVAAAYGYTNACVVFVCDGGANQATPGHIEIPGAGTTANVYKSFYENPWTNSVTAKGFYLSSFDYEF